MGVIDTEGKKYLSDNEIFADAFNYLVYGGKQVIKAAELREIDTTELAVPYGNNAKAPVQKYRDILKLWNAMMDDDAIYVILGAELQDKVHYGMPVKDGLYDMLGYSKQIEEIRRSYRKQGEENTGEISAEDGTLKIKLTSEEFLSGLRKGDKLIPIITAVVYLGDTPWDGPRSLHDMLDFKNDVIKSYVPDYKLNLISPADMEDEEETGGVDMCLAMEKKQQKDEINGVIMGMRLMGASDNDIIAKIIEKFNVTKEYVLALLTPQKA